MRPIEQGDIVDIYWDDDEVMYGVEVLHMPTSTGDMIYVRNKVAPTDIAKGHQEYVWGINPCGSRFNSIRKTVEY